MHERSSTPAALGASAASSPSPTGAADSARVAANTDSGAPRFLGIDVGAETIKIVEVAGRGETLRITRRLLVDHGKAPAERLREILSDLDWTAVSGAAATGRASRTLELQRVPAKAALSRGVRHLHGSLLPVTLVSIGSHGFGVLEIHGPDHEIFRENSRCSQGTGNFLRQLVERFSLTVEEASALCEDVAEPAALSGRCPVILKTDMTHLANKGEDRARILAGLYDAVCENVQVLIKARVSPPRVILTGGVTRSLRVRRSFERFLSQRGMELTGVPIDDALYFDALGAALVASEAGPVRLPALDSLIRDDSAHGFEHVPGLRSALDKVRRLPKVPFTPVADPRDVVLGFDIGSTGSKMLALDASSGDQVWEGYINTLGNPVGASQKLASMFLRETADLHRVRAIGATGSGREIVGSLMSACFGPAPVFVLNEIAAHAEGALYFDPAVDTIFEIGGQDAKYIRLDGGRICDAAMNEACSAGTGSFIEEQGKKFSGVDSIAKMGQLALDAGHGISLGQHCSVFMAEVIDEAVASGVSQDPILAGVYDSIIQNYLNRVKGSRSVGNRIFCQGMPFMADALAAAVARQTGRDVVVPPNPGTIGALGIARLAIRHVPLDIAAPPLDLTRFLDARVDRKDTFPCPSTRGCGEPGNKCKIDRIQTTVADKQLRFLWGGSCSLYDKGTHKKKLPDLSPDPFRERAALVARIVRDIESDRRGTATVHLTDEFALKGLLPFVATFVHRLGFDVSVRSGAGHASLRRGIEEGTVPWCAPMQLYQGVVAELLDRQPDILIVPRLRDLARQRGEDHGVTCPIVQASPDIVRKMGGATAQDGVPARRTRILTPRIDLGPGNYGSTQFRASAERLAAELGCTDWESAFSVAVAAQRTFERDCFALGARALAFARENQVIPVVVLGRAYTIHNDVLNSNVPNLLREQGAIAIPVDCYPIDAGVPVFEDLYWGYSQTNLRAAHQIRRTPGVYSVFCSNYSCGPDSFNLHFFSYVMENKPFAIIETDGHSGDAGTKTRIEAFLFCVESDRRLDSEQRAQRRVTEFKQIENDRTSFRRALDAGDCILIPRMGIGAEVLAEIMKGEGARVETLPIPTRESLRLGRRHTSGKECVPMTITLGSILDRLDKEPDPNQNFTLLMPKACGPCRFGVYHLLHKMVLEKTGHRERVRVLSPDSGSYFDGFAADFRIRALVGFAAADMLQAALHWVRPIEAAQGRANAIFGRYFAELKSLLRSVRPSSVVAALAELGGGMFGARDLVRRAADEFAAIVDPSRDVPTVSVVGEIYVRLDPFANDWVIEQLEKRGVRALLAPLVEWIEYTSHLKLQRLRENRFFATDHPASAQLGYNLEVAVINRIYGDVARRLGMPARTTVEDSLAAADGYISQELIGEAVLTLGGPLHEHLHGAIDGVVSVGPHECMPNKIAEAQFAHVAADHGLLSLTIPVNGDPVDPELIDRFAFEVREKHALRGRRSGPSVEHAQGFRLGNFTRGAFLNSLRMLAPLSSFGAERPPRDERPD